MAYELTLRDLSRCPATVNVNLQLHGCQEVLVTLAMTDPLSFARWIGLGKMIGSCMLLMTPSRLFTEEELLRDLDQRQLSRSDPMYRVTTDYDAHQHLRELVRLAVEHLPDFAPQEQAFLEISMAAVSVWMLLHDVQVADFMRARVLHLLQEHGRAWFMIGCSQNRAYVRRIGDDRVDLSRAIFEASRSVTSLRIPVTEEDRRPPSPTTRH